MFFFRRKVKRVRMVVFANSRKPGGRCVAGKIYENGEIKGWIRPVSTRQGQEINFEERKLGENAEPSLLDVLDISVFYNRVPGPGFQPENRLIYRKPWRKVDSLSMDSVLRYALDDPDTLWENGYDGKNSRIPAGVVSKRKRQLPSLYLIHTKVLLVDEIKHNGSSNTRWYGVFWHHGVKYKLRITDPVFETRLAQSTQRKFNNVILCISLGESHVSEYVDQGRTAYHYKLIAGVMHND